ncbi:MAG: hypothetical protein J3Q66DRAFT_385904 [Benniella sp.]|nr:MAG: hypothetical protein J3Q66DRAFT_385904 [Benniella sp.]
MCSPFWVLNGKAAQRPRAIMQDHKWTAVFLYCVLCAPWRAAVHILQYAIGSPPFPFVLRSGLIQRGYTERTATSGTDGGSEGCRLLILEPYDSCYANNRLSQFWIYASKRAESNETTHIGWGSQQVTNKTDRSWKVLILMHFLP